ncbi:hypothetical protein GW915_09210 [bacterium]|nr:hypothetical protein [bacterium]
MKKLITIIFALGVMPMSSAQESLAEAMNDSDQPAFDVLHDRFENAEPATFADIDGLWSGRCFSRIDKEAVSGSVLYSFTDLSEKGPLFPGETKTYVESFYLRSANSPSAYDDLEWIVEEAGGVEFFKSASRAGVARKTSTLAEETDEGVVSFSDLEPNGNLDTKGTYRLDGDFVLFQRLNLVEGNKIHDFVGRKTRSGVSRGPLNYCYFFRSVE